MKHFVCEKDMNVGELLWNAVDWVTMFPQNAYVKALISNVKVFEGRAFILQLGSWKWSLHKWN